jgi:peroxiredoxin
MSLLHPGDTFPELTLTVPGGKTVTVPQTFAGQFGVVLFYRGAWCPYCNAQLRAFQRASATLADAGVRAVENISPDDARLPGLSEVRIPSCRQGRSQERKRTRT